MLIWKLKYPWLADLKDDVIIVEHTVGDSQLSAADQLLQHHRKRPHGPWEHTACHNIITDDILYHTPLDRA